MTHLSEPPSRPLTARELAERLGYAPQTIHKWARQRRIPHMRYGRTIRFNPAQVAQIEATVSREPEVEVDVGHRNPDYRPALEIVPASNPFTAA